MGDQIVTVLDKTVGSRGKVKIRDSFGFTKEVSVKDLKLIPEGEPGASLKFGDDA